MSTWYSCAPAVQLFASRAMMTNALFENYVQVHSPTESSEDSVEVKISPIAFRKRKVKVEEFPLKKRLCLKAKEEPFRPWSPKPLALVKREEEDRVPAHPAPGLGAAEAEQALRAAAEAFPALQTPRREQRNYKNMTRERRIEANARERTRVHTISAAFDTLRKAIPSYSHNQKLSKLSVLRIACSYIMTLSTIVSGDAATAECVDLVTKTIQREGKLRKKKDDSD